MEKLKVGSKVRCKTGEWFEKGEMVTLTKLEKDGVHLFSNGEVNYFLAPNSYSILKPDEILTIPSPKFAVGDRVRLIEVNDPEYEYGITDPDYGIMTIKRGQKHTFANEYLYSVLENLYTYHENWLELVEDCENCEDIFECDRYLEDTFKEYEDDFEEEDIHYIIEGVHFGNSKIYSWLIKKDGYLEVKIGDVVGVNTIQGFKLVEVVGKRETLDVGNIYQWVHGKLEIPADF